MGVRALGSRPATRLLVGRWGVRSREKGLVGYQRLASGERNDDGLLGRPPVTLWGLTVTNKVTIDPHDVTLATISPRLRSACGTLAATLMNSAGHLTSQGRLTG